MSEEDKTAEHLEEKTEERLQAGWAKPFVANKWHYFKKGELRSICGRWMLAGVRDDTNDNSSENCAECKRRVAKMRWHDQHPKS